MEEDPSTDLYLHTRACTPTGACALTYTNIYIHIPHTHHNSKRANYMRKFSCLHHSPSVHQLRNNLCTIFLVIFLYVSSSCKYTYTHTRRDRERQTDRARQADRWKQRHKDLCYMYLLLFIKAKEHNAHMSYAP